MPQRTLFAAVLSISVFLIVLTFILPFSPLSKSFLAVLALFTDVLAFSTKYYAYIFIPFLRQKKGLVVLSDEEAFTTAPSENAIVTRQGSNVYASAFVKIPMYKSATEMNVEERTNFSKLFSRMVTISRNPVRFTSQLYLINKDTYINDIMERLNKSEEQYQNLNTAGHVSTSDQNLSAAAERVRGEVTMWHNLYDNVSKVRSQTLTTFAMVTAQGGTDEEAVNLALQQADELASGIGALLGITAYVIEGKELLNFVDVEHMIPPETVSEQMREKAVSEEM